MVKKRVSRKKKGINISSAVFNGEQRARMEEIEKKRKIKEITYFINSFKQAGFDNNKNPLFPWQIYLLCREADIPVPEDIFKYFDDCGSKLLDIENPGRKAPFLCYKALGFEKKGPGNPWAKFEDAMKIWGSYGRINSLMEADPKKWGSKSRAVKIVSEENNIGIEKLNKWYKKFEKSHL